MFEITYWQLINVITIAWLLIRVIVAVKNNKVSFLKETQMMLVYICIIVIARIVNFPWHHVNGQIGTMKFHVSKIIPPWVNLIPIVHLFDVYDGWQMNIIGNITMFIAGGGFSLFIEISQLLFYERCSDIDDLILNTTGVAIGAFIYFKWKRLHTRKGE